MKIKLLDTFAWVGWFHLALEQSIWKENIECIWYSEIDKFAKQVYNERFPNTKDLGSITEIDIDSLEDFDLLTGGFPCQDVSVAGKQSLEWGRTVLVEYLLQILEKKKPKYAEFENVKWLLSKKFTAFRESIFKRIEDAWYDVYIKVLNTKCFWLPQNRERVFMVCIRSDLNQKFSFHQWQELTTFLKDILEEEVDEKYYLSDKQFDSLTYDSIKRTYTDIAPTLDTAQGGHRQPKIRIKNATKIGYIEGAEWDGIILDNPNSKTKRGRVKHKISWTLTCAWSDWVIVKDLNIRKLTPTEYARLQWFPDNWSTDFVSNSQAYKQMWNAISVPVVRAIFNNLFNNTNWITLRHLYL